MKLLLRLGKIRNAFLLSMVIGFIALTITDSYSQSNRPEIPKLSLMGQDESYDTDFYPDGRIWVPPTTTGAREFLVPVFITNNWYSYQNAQGVALYSVNPITSFEFSIFYNGQAVRAIGVEKAHPSFVSDLDYEPLASTFEFKTDDFEDDYYWYFINPNKWADARDNEDGRRIVIAGASAKYLPNTDRQFKEYKVLLYVRFRVIATSKPGDPAFQLLQTSPMYIDNRKVNYNDMDVARDFAWQHMTDYDVNNYRNLYNRVLIGPNRGRLDGNLFVPESYLDGLNNAPISEDDNNIILPGPLQDDAMWKSEPVLPGVITLKISDAVPRFRVASVTDDEYESFNNGSLYHLPQVVTVDDNAPTLVGIANIKITNSTTKSRLNNIRIETDNDWLRILINPLNENRTLRVQQQRNGTAKWLDNGILGFELDPILKATQDDGDIFLTVQADPSRLTNKGDEPWGLHEGFITIHSDYAIVSPVRVRVLFYFLANPFEPSLTKTTPGGINLKVTNSEGTVGRSLNMVFGTGHRATDGIDLLYGELAYTTPLAADRFDVRFYPFPANPAIPYGFADFAPNLNEQRSVSRDIRNSNMPDSINSYIYLARFNNFAADYPIIVEWDTRDFPDGAQLFIRSVLQGQLSPATDMRLATSTGDFTRAFTIQDPRVKEFRIEYTLPSTIDFLDQDGNPIIKFGWNMLSMPLKPTNSKWDVVYKNAINIPYAFVNTQYQQREILKFGEGYFVKYPQTVDTKFAGAFITEVGVPNDFIRVYGGDAPDPGDQQYRGGWNLIGALSAETSIEGILFTPTPDGSLPNTDYTKRYDVWGYRTDLGYHAVSVLTPGMGYWIKTSGDGYLRLIYTPKNPFPPKQGGKNSVAYIQETKQNILDKSQLIGIRDNAQKSTQLYVSNNSNLEIDNFELPPTPPLGLFDIRFKDNSYLTNALENVITLQGATYPVSFTVNNAETNLTFIDPVTGEVYGTIEAGKSGSVQIRNLPFNSVKIMKPTSSNVSSFAFSTYPNPATHNATMTINLPESGIVVVGLYDALGNQVAILLNEEIAAGQFIHNVDLSAYASGSYTLKVVAGQFSTAAKLNIVK